jgi:hypothetical protein
MLKLNLLVDDPAGVKPGYLNLDPFAPEPCSDGRVRGALHQLHEHADGGEAAEVLALGVLEFFPAEAADKVLRHWVSKLAHGGTITLSCWDARELCRGYLAGTLSHDQFNGALHGAPSEQPPKTRLCCLTAQGLSAALEGLGLRVLTRRLSGYQAILTARRP